MSSVVILMGSNSDLPFVGQIAAALEGLGIAYEQRVASAHKSARYLLALLAEYEGCGGVGVYITVAGRSNALSGMVDANVTAPVIACPPYSGTFAGADLYSSLRMPSGVAPAVVLEPAAAALLAAKILAVGDASLRERIAAAQRAQTEGVISADKDLQANRP
ncbi:MAG: AIR carboxylase family protein [Anaerolineae bacterium]|nr:AIR carboxylase family protein [Anaerolineae bacterium]